MKRVECRDGGKFVIDGGEVSLLGRDALLQGSGGDWSDRLEKIRRAGFDTLSFYVPWFWHETKEGETDFEGRTSPERDLTGFYKAGHGIRFRPHNQTRSVHNVRAQERRAS